MTNFYLEIQQNDEKLFLWKTEEKHKVLLDDTCLQKLFEKELVTKIIHVMIHDLNWKICFVATNII